MVMRFLQPLVGEDGSGLVARLCRRRRLAVLCELLGKLARPIRILDVGGIPEFWTATGLFREGEIQVTVLNRDPVTPCDGIRALIGDARSMPQFSEDEFDLVFSNSVIEHVGSDEERRRMSAEVRRVGRRYFVQTPNRFFPIEPHFLVPFFQFLPEAVRISLLTHFDVGHFRRRAEADAREMVRSIRLLSRSELRDLFPDASIYEERVMGFTKSLMAAGGFG